MIVIINSLVRHSLRMLAMVVADHSYSSKGSLTRLLILAKCIIFGSGCYLDLDCSTLEQFNPPSRVSFSSCRPISLLEQFYLIFVHRCEYAAAGAGARVILAFVAQRSFCQCGTCLWLMMRSVPMHRNQLSVEIRRLDIL